MQQFLPERSLELSKKKKINHKGESLRVAYLIDIMHNMILRYFFERVNKFAMSSRVLRDKYGCKANYYMDYLESSGYIKMVANYSVGNNCKIYQIDNAILTNNITKFSNKDKMVIKKHIKLQKNVDPNNLILADVKNKMFYDLEQIDINHPNAEKRIKDECLHKGSLVKNKYVIDTINSKQIFYNIDHYGRLHSNFTILKKSIRLNDLSIDGSPVVEVDLPNSQLLFLCKLIEDNYYRYNKLSQYEFGLFKSLVTKGNYYEYMASIMTVEGKEAIKKETYRLLFGHTNRSDLNAFKERFPTIFEFVRQVKENVKNHKVIAHELQKLESDFIYNRVVKSLMGKGNPTVLTIHDSFIVKEQDKQLVKDTILEELGKLMPTYDFSEYLDKKEKPTHANRTELLPAFEFEF
jgi:hypothetical protein